MCFDIENVYLRTPLGRPEYVKIQLSKIPEEFITEYNLTSLVHKGWIYFEICCGCYGLTQSGMLENKQLRLRLEKEGYYEARNTPGIWRHKWRPIQFCLFVDDFGVEYVGKQHADHLATILKNITIPLKIGKARSMLASIKNGIMTREHVGQLWMDTSWTSETNFNTCNLKNPNIHHTNTAP